MSQRFHASAILPGGHQQDWRVFQETVKEVERITEKWPNAETRIDIEGETSEEYSSLLDAPIDLGGNLTGVHTIRVLRFERRRGGDGPSLSVEFGEESGIDDSSIYIMGPDKGTCDSTVRQLQQFILNLINYPAPRITTRPPSTGSQILVKGQNVAVPTLTVHAVLSWAAAPSAPDIDVSALLLTAGGRVRSDEDFVFYNQPAHASGTVRHVGKRQDAGNNSDSVTVALGSMEPAVDRIVIAASADGAFGRVPDMTLRLLDGGRNLLAEFAVRGEGTETSMVAGELYRRSGQWKFRAVGQGFTDGLAGLATAFGIDVEPEPSDLPQPASAGVVNLDKGRVLLRRDDVVSLSKTGAPPLTRIRMGLGWDPAKAGQNIDLDASVIAFVQGKKKTSVSFMQLTAFRKAIQHTGDNLTGDGEGDDEQIRVTLDRLPAEVDALVFTVNSFRGHLFTDISNAYCRLIDDLSGTELVRFDLTEAEPYTGVIMAVLTRNHGSVWAMRAVGAFHDGSTVDAMEGPATAMLARLR